MISHRKLAHGALDSLISAMADAVRDAGSNVIDAAATARAGIATADVDRLIAAAVAAAVAEASSFP